jgi:hypothetical protein
MQAHPCCPEIKVVGTKHKKNEKAWRKSLEYGKNFVSFLGQTRTWRLRIWWTKASVSCSNRSVVATCEHAYSASSSTRL